MNYGTANVLNITSSLAFFISQCPDATFQKFYRTSDPTVAQEQLAAPFYLAYLIQKMKATGYRQETQINFYAVAMVNTEFPTAQARLWTTACTDIYTAFFKEYAPRLYNFAALCSDALWADFLQTGVFAPLEPYFTGQAQQIGDLVLHVAEWGDVVTEEYDNRIETTWDVTMVHQAIDNIQNGALLPL